MKKQLFTVCAIAGLAAVLCTFRSGGASLGGSADSIEQDRRSVGAEETTTTLGNGFEVWELRSAASSVREYIGPSGVVFGIAWNGPTRPDLAQLLGRYDEKYEEALRSASREPGRPFVKVDANGLLVEQWGHIRDLRGRAYVADLLPSGVSPDVIK